MYFIDHDINRRNYILLKRLQNYIWKVKCRTIFTDMKYRFLKNIPKQHKGYLKKWKSGKSKTRKLRKSRKSRKYYFEFCHFHVFDFALKPKSKIKNLDLKNSEKDSKIFKVFSFWSGLLFIRFILVETLLSLSKSWLRPTTVVSTSFQFGILNVYL